MVVVCNAVCDGGRRKAGELEKKLSAFARELPTCGVWFTLVR